MSPADTIDAVRVEEVVHDLGTIVVLRGWSFSGHRVTFAVDHRPAMDIRNALAEGKQPVARGIKRWQVIP